jgi:hypothetical protein
MHRVTSISSGALDALPHNGAVITVLAICSVGHHRPTATSSWSPSPVQ